MFPGRYFVTVPEESAERRGIPPLEDSRGQRLRPRDQGGKSVDAVLAAAVEVARGRIASGNKSFKAESRRSDKSFPLGSFELSARIGDAVLEAFPESRVDLHHPDFTINAEIRERAYVFGTPSPGSAGFPQDPEARASSSSGGIDSPVAGYMMARRGLALEALYFHAYPYTSMEAQEKVVSLAKVLATYAGGMALWTAPFTETQLKIKKDAREDLTTLMMRSAMMRAAQILAGRIGANCIVTGDSLGQVASQTAENLRLTQSLTDYPVLRPLVGASTRRRRSPWRRGSAPSISPSCPTRIAASCSPEHPMLKAKLERERRAYDDLALDPLILDSLEKAQRLEVPFTLTR